MINRLILRFFSALAIFGLVANALGLAYLIYNTVRLLAGT